MFRNRRSYPLLILILLMVFCFLAACSKDNGDKDKNNIAPSPGQQTAVPTQDPKIPTAVPTQTPVPTPTKAPLSEDQINAPFSSELEGIDILYSEDYESGEWNTNGEVDAQRANYIQVIDGKMYFPYVDDAFKKDWAAVTFPVELDFTAHKQYEISMDFQTDGSIAHKSIFGFFVTDYGRIPTKSGDGIWVTPGANGSLFFLGLSPDSNGTGGWGKNNGFAKISIPEGFDTMKKIIFVLTKGTVTGYMVKSDGNQAKMFTIEILEEELVIYDSTGTESFRDKNDISFMEGPLFKLMSHYCTTIIDNVLIRGY